MTPLRALLSWFVLLAVAFANGALREVVYTRALGTHRAHQVSVFVGIVLLGLAMAGLERRWRLARARDAWRTGALWAALTAAFETGLGAMGGLSAREILGTYAVWRGELWPLVIAWVLVAPWLLFARGSRASAAPRGDGSGATPDPAAAFLRLRRIAIAGVSRRERDFSRVVVAELARRGYEVLPVNPAAATIDGLACHARVSDVRPAPDALLVLTAPADAEGVVRDALAAGVRQVWFHRGAGAGAASDAALAACREAGVVPVTDLCPFMALPRAGPIHGIHARFRRWSLRRAA